MIELGKAALDVAKRMQEDVPKRGTPPDEGLVSESQQVIPFSIVRNTRGYLEKVAKSSLDKRDRNELLGRVANNMEVWSKHCPRVGCALYPDLHNRWGWALSEQRQFSKAIEHYHLAISAKQNYTPAYIGLSEVYLELNQIEDARKILVKGLKVRPKSRLLQRRLKKLENNVE